MSYFLPPVVSKEAPQAPIPPPKQLDLRPPKERVVSADAAGSRPSSISHWMRNVLPSRKPERGGTARDQGYWEQLDSNPMGRLRPIRRVTDSYRSRRSDTGASDLIVRWNTAKDILNSESRTKAPEHRTPSAQFLPLPRGGEKQNHEAQLEQPRAKSSDRMAQASSSKYAATRPGNPLLDGLQLRVTRRLSNAHRHIETRKTRRQQRNWLKQSGDHLDITGINPRTGMPDTLTPTNSSQGSVASRDTEDMLNEAVHAVEAEGQSPQTKLRNLKYLDSMLSKLENGHLSKRQKRKKALERQQANGSVRWRRSTKEWSLAQEPELSPIAQSRRSTAAFSRQFEDSTRQHASTKQPLALSLKAPRTRHRLPKMAHQPVTMGAAEHRSRKQSADLKVNDLHFVAPDGELLASESSSTVIHTPFRQSLATVSASALELYENGISFADSASNNNEVRNAAAAPLSPTSPLRPGLLLPDEIDNRGASEGYGNILFIPAHQDVNATVRGHAKAFDTEPEESRSFLEKETKRMSDPSRVMHQMTDMEPISNTFKLPPARPSRSLGSLFIRKTRVPSDPKSAGITESFDSSPATHRTMSAMLPGTIHTTSETTDSHALQSEESPFQNIIHRVPGLRKPIVTSQDVRANRAESHSLRAFQSLLNLPANIADISEHQQSTKTSIQLQMAKLKDEVANLNQPQNTAQNTVRDQGETDHDWIQSTIREINDKGNEIETAPAFTPTTITTGYGLVGLMSNQGESDALQKQLQTAHFQQLGQGPELHDLNLSNCNKLSQKTSRQYSRPSYPPKTAQSILPRSEYMQVTGAADDSSLMKQRAATVHRTAELINGQGACAGQMQNLPTQKHHSPSYTSTFTELHGRSQDLHHHGTGEKLPSNSIQTEDRVEKGIGMSKKLQSSCRPTIEASAVNVQKQRGRLAVMQPAVAETGHTAKRKATGRDLETSLRAGNHVLSQPWMPGSFPTPAGAEDDTADLFRNEHIDLTRAWLMGKPQESPGRRVVALMSAVLFMYWKYAGPVLDYRSEYWKRNARHETSLCDGVSLALAVPGAVLGVAALV